MASPPAVEPLALSPLMAFFIAEASFTRVDSSSFLTLPEYVMMAILSSGRM